MTITYLFKFELNDFDLSILTDSRIIPRPAGVDVIIKVELPTEDED